MKRNGEQRHERSRKRETRKKDPIRLYGERGRKSENKFVVRRTKHKTRLQCREPLLLIHPNMKTNRKKYVTGAKALRQKSKSPNVIEKQKK